MTSKSQSEETETKKTPVAEFIEQMMSACGSETKQWMEACTANTGEVKLELA